MQMPESTESRLYIRKVRSRYLVSQDHPSPLSVRHTLDGVAQKEVPRILKRILSGYINDSSDAVIFIRRLDLRMDINASWDADYMGKYWAEQIGKSLVTAIARKGENVVIFKNRAAYLSCFLVDRADDNDSGVWYYRQFDGLKMLPKSTALRTALCDTPQEGLSALIQTDEKDMARIVSRFSQADAGHVLFKLSANSSGHDITTCFTVLYTEWTMMRDVFSHEGQENSIRLYLYLKAVKQKPDFSGKELRSVTMGVVRLTLLLLKRGHDSRRALEEKIVKGDMAGLVREEGIDHASVLSPLFPCEPSLIEKLCRAVPETSEFQHASESNAPAASSTQEPLGVLKRSVSGGSPNITGPGATGSKVKGGPQTHPVRYTSFGGLFLLLPIIDRLPFDQICPEFLDGGTDRGADLLRFLVLTACFGENAGQIFFDPIARDFMGISALVTPASISSWMKKFTDVSFTTLDRRLHVWREMEHIVKNDLFFLAGIRTEERKSAALVDGLYGVWLDIIDCTKPEKEISDRICRVISSSKQTDILVCYEPTFSRFFNFPDLPCKCASFFNAAMMENKETGHVISQFLQRLHKLPADIDYPDLGKIFECDFCFGTLIRIAAQNVMRIFSRSLTGFASSGLDYLYRNFLAFEAEVTDEPDRRLVKIGKPPLHIILHMTGLAGRQLKPRCGDIRPILIYQE